MFFFVATIFRSAYGGSTLKLALHVNVLSDGKKNKSKYTNRRGEAASIESRRQLGVVHIRVYVVAGFFLVLLLYFFLAVFLSDRR